MSELLSSTITTPIGPFSFTTRSGKVIEASFAPIARLKHRGRIVRTIPNVSKALRSYFEGDLNALNSIPVELKTTPFTSRVLKNMRRIKSGKVMSYQDLARHSGSPRASRAVGSACAKNAIPLIIPCHRVIRSEGSLGNYGYGVAKKRWLLEFEGAIQPS